MHLDQGNVTCCSWFIDLTNSLHAAPSILKSHAAWSEMKATLNRGDELGNLPISCLQPHKLFIPSSLNTSGRIEAGGEYRFGILSLFHETKTAKPGVSSLLFILLFHRLQALFNSKKSLFTTSIFHIAILFPARWGHLHYYFITCSMSLGSYLEFRDGNGVDQ